MNEHATGRAEGRDGAASDGASVFVVIGVVVIGVWCSAIATGLGRVILGPSPSPYLELALYLPGVLVGAGLVVVGALRRMGAHAPRWVPRVAPPPPVVMARAPTIEPLVRQRVARETNNEALAIVHLGPQADPAWAAWGLRWEAPGHGTGLVPLPSGARIIVGRDPSADVVARLDQVSWRHLELDVQERTPWPWQPGETLSLTHPVALTLTLEPLR